MTTLLALLFGLGAGQPIGAIMLTHANQVAYLATIVLDDDAEVPSGLDDLISPAPARRQAVPKKVRPRERDRKVPRSTAVRSARQIEAPSPTVLWPLTIPKQGRGGKEQADLPPPLKSWLATAPLAAKLLAAQPRRADVPTVPTVPQRDKVWVPERTLPRLGPALLTIPW